MFKNNQISIITVFLFTWAICPVIRTCCADSPSIIIRPGESSSDSNQTSSPAPPARKRGFLRIPKYDPSTNPERDVPVYHDPHHGVFIPEVEEELVLPAIRVKTEEKEKVLPKGQLKANQPVSLQGTQKTAITEFPQLRLKTSPVVDVPRSRIMTGPKLIPRIEQEPARTTRGVRLLPQIEVPVEKTGATPTLNRQINYSSEEPVQPVSLPEIERVPYRASEKKNSTSLLESNSSQNSRPSVSLTGIKTEDEDDYFDKEFLYKEAGVELPTEKELDQYHLLPLEEELANHGGSHLYLPEGDVFYYDNNSICEERCHDHCEHGYSHEDTPLRLPENWQKPRPLTGFQEFLGADFINPYPGLQWFGENGYQWEPRFVGYGGYEIFGGYFKEGNREQTAIGHQLLVDLDLRITGTERAHVQFRPLGRKNSGGSYYRFNDPTGYDDNSTLIPDRYWVEGELRSIFNSCFNDSFTPLDYHFVAGKFPLVLQNNLLMTDDVLGVIVNKNTLLIPPLSNMNIQVFYLFDDVDTTLGPTADVVGTNISADYLHSFLEGTYAYVNPSGMQNGETSYAAGAWTNYFGQLALTGRVLYKTGQSNTLNDALLYVLESNYHTPTPESFYCCTGFDQAVFYTNAFYAEQGWASISGGNFDRLRSVFAVDPLVSISRNLVPVDTTGVSFGCQLFGNHEDESLIPEIAYEEPGSDSMYGFSIRYLYKLGPRTYLDCQGIRTWSNNSALERKGIFASTTVLF